MHPVLIVDKIAHKFILGNDFLTKYNCDLLNSAKAIVFGGQQVPYTLFRSTVNSICPVICSSATTVGPYEEMVIPALLDAKAHYATNQTLLLEPTTSKSTSPILKARVVVNYTSVVVPLLVANVSSIPITIEKGEVLAEDQPLVLTNMEEQTNQQLEKKTTPVQEALNKADSSLTTEQKSSLTAVLNKHSDVFSSGANDIGRTNLIYHTIDIGDSGPVRQGMRRIPHEQIGVLKTEVDKLRGLGMVEASSSPFASPTILVKKKDGNWRLCIDYRKLNSVTKKDAHPLPRIEDIFDTLAGSKFFTTLDLAMGYHQVEMHPNDKEKTAFSTPFGLFQYRVMPFGLATAPATFMRLMTIVFSGLLYSTCLAYLDDIIIFGRTFTEHLERLDLALRRLENANLKLKPSKCSFGQRSVTFLGHIISDKGISTDPEKLKRIQTWPQPRNQGDMRTFLGYASYYRKFIKGFAQIVAPLNRLLQKEEAYKWSADCDTAFEAIKQAFSDTVTLSHPNFKKTFIVDTDASDYGIGGVLSQKNEQGREQPVAYYSRTLSKPERKYAVTRKEMLAVVESLKHFRFYVLGRHFIVRSDHSALQWLRNFKEPAGQVARWLERLAEYDFEIVHRAGKNHANADGLSRIPTTIATVTDEEMWIAPALKTEFCNEQRK